MSLKPKMKLSAGINAKMLMDADGILMIDPSTHVSFCRVVPQSTKNWMISSVGKSTVIQLSPKHPVSQQNRSFFDFFIITFNFSETVGYSWLL